MNNSPTLFRIPKIAQIFFASLLSLVLLSGTSHIVSAQEVISASIPAAGDQLENPPETIRITFIEPVIEGSVSVQLLHLEEGNIAAGDVDYETATSISFPILGERPDGVYVVMVTGSYQQTGASFQESYTFLVESGGLSSIESLLFACLLVGIVFFGILVVIRGRRSGFL